VILVLVFIETAPGSDAWPNNVTGKAQDDANKTKIRARILIMNHLYCQTAEFTHNMVSKLLVNIQCD